MKPNNIKKEIKKRIKKLQGECNTVELLEFVHTDSHYHAFWKCKCLRCGTIFIARKDAIDAGTTKSCGCLHSEISVQVGKITGLITAPITGRKNKTHGETINHKPTTEYRAWKGMQARCYNSNEPVYPFYGGRGITVCDGWLGKDGFNNFLKDVGRKPAPEYSLDRFPDNDGNYEPGNVRWATNKEQARNTRMSSKSKDYDQHKYWRKNLQDTVHRVTAKIINKSPLFEKYVGCTPEEFRNYIEFQFEPWMNWDNYGPFRKKGPRTWQVDHIIPCNQFDLSIEKERLNCFNKLNLRPYDSLKNRKEYSR